MIRIATVFSGIGAIEHALDRMNLDHEIVFACDNGDVDILTKDIGMSIDDIQVELNQLSQTISANLLFAHWAFLLGCAIMWMMIETRTAGAKGGRICTTDSQKSAGGICVSTGTASTRGCC